MAQSNDVFIEQIATYIKKYAPKYNIQVYSPIIAQAILESASGTSELATKANNYFGIKYKPGRCPTANGVYYKAGSEQNPDGSYTTSAMQWCKFPSMEAGVIGYFDFINIDRYSNLKDVTSPELYLKNIKDDGYATSNKYVANLLNVIETYKLTKYDVKGEPENSAILYRVQVGAYIKKENAQAMLNKLKKAGFDGFIVEVKK